MSKARIKQIAMKNALRIWEVASVDQLDPIVKLFIEVFAALVNDNSNAIEDMKTRLLEQIADSLTPDPLISAKPSHSVMKAMPLETEMEIGKKDIFYTNTLTNLAKEIGLKHLHFAPVANHIKLVRGRILHILSERDLYETGYNGEKELVAKATSFNESLNGIVWLGLELDPHIQTLKDIPFYIDFPNTDHRRDLFELLMHTVWEIDGRKMAMGTGLAASAPADEIDTGIFSHYNTSYRNDEEVLDIYRKQFLHVKDAIDTRKPERTPFPAELRPFFPERTNELPPQYWIKITFPPYFCSEDLEDLHVSLNVFPVANKNLCSRRLEREKELAGILPLSVGPGEYFLSPDRVESAAGMRYHFLPFSTEGRSRSGSYTIKRGGLERFSTRDLSDTVEYLIDLFRSEAVTFNAIKLDNIRNSISQMEQFIASVNVRLEGNNSKIKEMPAYLLIDSEEKHNTLYASYWTSNCHVANHLPFGTIFSPVQALPFRKDTCILFKASSGGKTAAKHNERIEAYRYVLTTRDQLYSITDIENFCRVTFGSRIQQVKARLGVSVSHKQKEGLIRTLDVCLTPSEGYRELLLDPVRQGELKEELEKRSPELYNYRIMIES